MILRPASEACRSPGSRKSPHPPRAAFREKHHMCRSEVVVEHDEVTELVQHRDARSREVRTCVTRATARRTTI